MLPPTIPTSFVPHTPRSDARKFSADFGGAFGFAVYLFLGAVFILAIGIFVYGRVLDSTQSQKKEAVKQALDAIDEDTVKGFVHLRDRLAEGQKLLNGHMAFTGFFSAMEKILPASVRLSSVHLSLDNGGTPKLEGSGVAKTFNALAAASVAFAADGRIKSAIFSNISINKDSTVSFVLSATLDPSLVAFTP